MAFTIITKYGEKTFAGKELVNISSKEGYDYCANFGFDFMLTIQYNKETNTCTILNPYNSQNFLFKGQTLPQSLEIEKICKLMIKNSDDFITIKLVDAPIITKIAEENFTEEDLKDLYGGDIKASAKLKLEKRKSEIEQARVGIVKQVSYKINDLKHKISMNSKAGIILHIALFVASFILGFAISNYFTGLPLKDAGNIIHMPINLKLALIYTIIVYGVGLSLKQGIFLLLQNKMDNSSTPNTIAEKFMIVTSGLFFAAVYIINVLYYMTPDSMPFFAILMPLFSTGTCVALSMACGYFKSNNIESSKELDKYEYRVDFEQVMKEYRQWIEHFVNNLSNTKIRNIKDKLFMLQLKSIGEIVLGILTAPFLAYGVSNTLAMCFPEAAGWIRISGLRLSPVFLVLATFLIIFAFFAFVNAFLCNKKIQSSNVIKNDGFTNYIQHGVDIFGLEGIRKLNVEMRRSFIIGLCIIFIEFSMNISYFMQEIGGDLGGLFLSAVAALVPTALLIAETYMLSQTKFEMYASEELIAKLDRD